MAIIFVISIPDMPNINYDTGCVLSQIFLGKIGDRDFSFSDMGISAKVQHRAGPK